MARLIHVSDLHFGRLDERTLAPLRAATRELAPALVVVSGDLTQRARTRQFRAARDYLDGLGVPWLATPGNHDVPLWNPIDRLARPLARYRRHFCDETEPVHEGEGFVAVGVDTTRSFVVKGGRINREQIQRLRRRLGSVPEPRLKILVTHHPIAAPPGLSQRDRAGRAELALDALAEAGVDLLLAGHLHRASASAAAGRGPGGWCAVGVSAGTTTSSRLRSEQNGFNEIELQATEIGVRRWRFEDSVFRAAPEWDRFARGAAGWKRVEAAS